MESGLNFSSRNPGNVMCQQQLQPQKKKRYRKQSQRQISKLLLTEEQYHTWIKKQSDLFIPKMIHNDIRKSYIPLFIYAFNTNEISFMDTFLTHYSTENICHTQIFDSFGENQDHLLCHTDISPSPPVYVLNFCGLQNALQYWHNFFQMIPNATFHSLSDVQIYNYAHTAESKIVTKIKVTATKIYDTSFTITFPSTSTAIICDKQDICLKKDVDCVDVVKDVPVSSTVTDVGVDEVPVVQISDNIRDVLDSTRLMTNPFTFTCDTLLTMYLDSNKFVQKIELNAS